MSTDLTDQQIDDIIVANGFHNAAGGIYVASTHAFARAVIAADRAAHPAPAEGHSTHALSTGELMDLHHKHAPDCPTAQVLAFGNAVMQRLSTQPQPKGTGEQKWCHCGDVPADLCVKYTAGVGCTHTANELVEILRDEIAKRPATQSPAPAHERVKRWAEQHHVSFISRSHGLASTDTISFAALEALAAGPAPAVAHQVTPALKRHALDAADRLSMYAAAPFFPDVEKRGVKRATTSDWWDGLAELLEEAQPLIKRALAECTGPISDVPVQGTEQQP